MVSLTDDALITLRDLEREIRAEQPPKILMARKKAWRRRKKKAVATAMPDPMIGFEVQNVGRLSNLTIGEEEMSMRGVVVTREIPFPGSSPPWERRRESGRSRSRKMSAGPR